MNKQEILLALDELLELNKGTLTGDEVLAELGNWDSLAVIGLIALADERFNKILAPSAIANARTVNDVTTLLGC